MKRSVTLVNRQRAVTINLPRLRRILGSFLDRLCPAADLDLAFNLVATPEIIGLNETFLQHAGPTDVITFNYSEAALGTPTERPALCGEIFVCVDEAIGQARQFRTTWQSELVRYLVHGVLHLAGYDDRRAADRRRMKRAEDQWMRRLAAEFPLNQLGRRAASLRIKAP